MLLVKVVQIFVMTTNMRLFQMKRSAEAMLLIIFVEHGNVPIAGRLLLAFKVVSETKITKFIFQIVLEVIQATIICQFVEENVSAFKSPETFKMFFWTSYTDFGTCRTSHDDTITTTQHIIVL